MVSNLGKAFGRLAAKVIRLGFAASASGVKLMSHATSSDSSQVDTLRGIIPIVKVVVTLWYSESLTADEISALPKIFVHLNVVLCGTQFPAENPRLYSKICVNRAMVCTMTRQHKRGLLTGETLCSSVCRRLCRFSKGDLVLTRQDFADIE